MFVTVYFFILLNVFFNNIDIVLLFFAISI